MKGNMTKWIRFNQEYPQRWSYKKDIPDCWQHWAICVRFLFEDARNIFRNLVDTISELMYQCFPDEDEI